MSFRCLTHTITLPPWHAICSLFVISVQKTDCDSAKSHCTLIDILQTHIFPNHYKIQDYLQPTLLHKMAARVIQESIIIINIAAPDPHGTGTQTFCIKNFFMGELCWVSTNTLIYPSSKRSYNKEEEIHTWSGCRVDSMINPLHWYHICMHCCWSEIWIIHLNRIYYTIYEISKFISAIT